MEKIDVLDHGFVILRNIAGPTRRPDQAFDVSDIDPAQVARISFEQMGSDRTYEQDMKLNRYLWDHEHTSPFEMVQVWLEVKCPIFVDRQWVRHRTWSRNESSGRYVELPREYYIPDIVGGKAANKKQGQENNLCAASQEIFKDAFKSHSEAAHMMYSSVIKDGMAPEHARMFLPLNQYVHWIGSVNLANLFRFIRLRADPHAQIEIQEYARAILQLLRPHIPGLVEIFENSCIIDSAQ